MSKVTRLDDNVEHVELEEGVDVIPTSLEEALTAECYLFFEGSGVDGYQEAWTDWRRKLYQKAEFHEEEMDLEVPKHMHAETYDISYPDDQETQWLAGIWPNDGAARYGGYYIWSTAGYGYYYLPYEVADDLMDSVPTYSYYYEDEGDE